jgi:TrmH family RNA methyltransferase
LASYDVSSTVNDQVKRLVRLHDRRHRDSERLFVVEEPRIMSRAIDSGHIPAELYACPDDNPELFGLPHQTMSPEAMNKASYRNASTGLIALFSYLDTGLDRIPESENPLLLVSEGLEKPGNLGALLRVADGTGVDGVILVEPAPDPFNPNTVRASTGCLFTVPVAISDVQRVASWIADRGVQSVVATPEASQPYWDADLGSGCAIWVGAEASGLSASAKERADQQVSIPMAGAADSLNTSVAAALLLYEARRQRRQVAL